MRVRVLTPVEVVLDCEVDSLVADGRDGSFCLRPRHVDFVSALDPGLLQVDRPPPAGREFLAVDRGVLVKSDATVFVSVRDAVYGPDLDQLSEIARVRFSRSEEQRVAVRSAVTRLEAAFVRRFLQLK